MTPHGVLSLLLACCAAPRCDASATTISNVVPRIDVDGALMDVHDGNVMLFEGTYYWWGMGYNNCTEGRGIIPPQDCPGIYRPFGECGFREDHKV